MVHRSLACAVLVACAASTVLVVPADAQTRGVVELFTSQGCSSCPPADKLLGALAADPTLIAVSLPIDYWDYLGWKDTLADPRNSARQKAYSKVRGDREVYTPQVVVNGLVQALGSDSEAIERAVAQSRKGSWVLSVPVTLSIAERQLVVAVPDRADLRSGAEIWFWGLSKAVSVAIKRGENKGKTITYHNVVRRALKLDGWDGKANTWTVPIGEFGSEVDSAAVVVQSGMMEKPGVILGAAMAAIR
jgi:hypothetical protein